MTIHCKVVSLTYLNTKTLAVCLQADREFEFKAGQYVFIDLGESGKLPFSIASMPAGGGLYLRKELNGASRISLFRVPI